MPRWTRRGHALIPRPPLWRRLAGWLGILILFAAVALVAARLDPLPPRFSGTAFAADGDSLRLGSDRIRLLDVDAPELDQVCWRSDGTEWGCGRASRDMLQGLVAAGSTECQPEGTDKYGRTLARCRVAGDDLGATIVASGLAIADGSYATEQLAARAARRGIWSGRFTNPREWRDEGPQHDPGEGWLQQLWNWFRELTGARALR